MRIDASTSLPEDVDYITQLSKRADIIQAEWQRDILENGPISREKERQYIDRMLGVTQQMIDGFVAHNKPRLKGIEEILAELGDDW